MKDLYVIGLTGGIASGKSEAARILRSLSANVIDLDALARTVVMPGSVGALAVRRAFGDEYFFENGELDRAKLGEFVFANENALRTLERITHPLILDELSAQLDKIASKGGKIVFIETALPDKLLRSTDEFWLIVAGDDLRLSRLMARSGLTREQALKRMNSQAKPTLPEGTRIIKNSGELSELKAQIELLYAESEARFANRS